MFKTESKEDTEDTGSPESGSHQSKYGSHPKGRIIENEDGNDNKTDPPYQQPAPVGHFVCLQLYGKADQANTFKHEPECQEKRYYRHTNRRI